MSWIIVRTPVAYAQTCTPTSTFISSEFNGTEIDAGSWVWFNANFKLNGDPQPGTQIVLSNAAITFTPPGGTLITLPVPDAVITFDAVSGSTTGFSGNSWQTTVPMSGSDEIFLTGVAFHAVNGLPKGIKDVVWSADVGLDGDVSDLSIDWKWSAAVYTSFTDDYDVVGVKPTHTNAAGYSNSDHAGTPEPWKSYVTGGARGGGGSNWTGSWSGTENVELPCLLPVELTRFDVVLDARTALLRWDTASETGNAGFEIQRLSKSEGASPLWKVVDFVEGHGTTELPQSYSYRVEALAPGRHVFRLKQIDFDGTFAYSPEVEVGVEIPDAFTVSAVYPNPFNPQASFSFGVRQRQQVTVEVFNMLGQQVLSLFRGTPEAGLMQTLQIDASGLRSGSYVVRVLGENFVDTQTITLIK